MKQTTTVLGRLQFKQLRNLVKVNTAVVMKRPRIQQSRMNNLAMFWTKLCERISGKLSKSTAWLTDRVAARLNLMVPLAQLSLHVGNDDTT